MSKYQNSKLVMEKFLRRSFYDAVLELYETEQGIRIISVSLEGHLSLVVNKDENFSIKLNEVAQRADDSDENHKFKNEGAICSNDVKSEEQLMQHKCQSHRYQQIKKEDELYQDDKDVHQRNVDTGIASEFDMSEDSSVVLEPTDCTSVNDKSDNFLEIESSKYLDHGTEKKGGENDTEGHSSNNRSKETDSEIVGKNKLLLSSQQANDATYVSQPESKVQILADHSISGDTNYLFDGQADDGKRKIDHVEQAGVSGKRSPRKKQRTFSMEEFENENEINDKGKLNTPASPNIDDGAAGGLQLLPHTGQ